MMVVKFILWVLEYLLKACASIAVFIVVAAKGSFIYRVGSAFLSFDDLLNNLVAWPERISYMDKVVTDYQTLTAARFNSKYGTQALDTVLNYLNDGLQFIQRVYDNFTHFPIRTISSTLLIFVLFYAVARSLRFIRQKGQGSILTRKEREWGDKLFAEEIEIDEK